MLDIMSFGRLQFHKLKQRQATLLARHYSQFREFTFTSTNSAFSVEPATPKLLTIARTKVETDLNRDRPPASYRA